MRTASKEQLEAIKSSGSVLLSAGAGSGKTYVLVEHIVFLAGKFIEREKQAGAKLFLSKIKKYFSTIVLITFTRKSTAEIRLRMKARVEEEAFGEGDKKIYWEKVLKALPLLTISTIHGFCSLLLRQGFFPGFGRSFEIMNELEGGKRIEKLFVEWFEFEKEKESFKGEEKSYEVIVANRYSIVEGLTRIFNDPTLRKSWKEFQLDSRGEELDAFMKRYLECTGLDRVFLEGFDLKIDGKAKKWQSFLQDFYKLKKHEIGTPKGIQTFSEFFSSCRIMVPSKNVEGCEEIREHIEGIKKLRKFLQDYKDDLLAFEEHRNKMYEWVRLFHSAFNYIEKHYRRNSKMSYSDLEYYVLEGLESSEAVEKISHLYQYIVIDEFQDTSHVQFEIIRKIVKGNYKKLFCVGDYKQAIYGFRGGEVAVFEQCREQMKNNLNLLCNFRSEKTIVEFNNRFFSDLLNCGDSFEYIGSDEVCVRGRGFSGKNDKRIEFIHQKSPEKNDEGIIFQHKIVVSQKKPDVEKVEARKIFDLIDSMKKAGDVSEVAVLYKKLTPSKFLMEHLLSNKIPFISQVKIPYGDDPIVGICMILLEFCLACKEGKHSWEKLLDYPKFMMLSYFNLMGFRGPENLALHLEKFLNNVHLYGFESAYCVFIYDLGISNSNCGQNVKIIKDLYDMFGEDWESVYNALKKNSGRKYSVDVHFGERVENEIKIVIMTVHSSKGLEFEHVILGGIQGIGRSGGEGNYIGKHPAAIKWKFSSEQKKPFRSPELILEKHTSSQKDFAESKRLFYVACTRAVRGLHWVDVSVEKKVTHEKSWVLALRKWCDSSSMDGINFRNTFWREEGEECGNVSISGVDVWGGIERRKRESKHHPS